MKKIKLFAALAMTLTFIHPALANQKSCSHVFLTGSYVPSALRALGYSQEVGSRIFYFEPRIAETLLSKSDGGPTIPHPLEPQVCRGYKKITQEDLKYIYHDLDGAEIFLDSRIFNDWRNFIVEAAEVKEVTGDRIDPFTGLYEKDLSYEAISPEEVRNTRDHFWR